MNDPLLERAASLLRAVPDYPKAGITFFDLQPLLQEPAVMRHLTERIAEHWSGLHPEVIAAFDSRGFLFGPSVAQHLDLPFVMIRKRNKLPPPVKRKEFVLEYGADAVDMADDGFLAGKRVLLLDDLLATGGTARAGVELVHELGGTPIGFACITELPELGGRQNLLGIPVQSFISVMDGEPLVGVEYCVDVLARSHDDGQLLLVHRLGSVPGIAMPGGRIEPHESAFVAANRELAEETRATIRQVSFAGILTGIDRDPRGPKVSLVLAAKVRVGVLCGESGVTDPFLVPHPEALPEPEAFVFGHGHFVHEHWPALLEREGALDATA